jgi:hypothetical protein
MIVLEAAGLIRVTLALIQALAHKFLRCHGARIRPGL